MNDKVPVKLLYVITRLDKGGSSEVVLQLARALHGRQFSIGIAYGVTVEPQEDLEKFKRDSAISLHFVSHLRRNIHPIHDLLALVQLYRIIRHERPTILHTHTSKAGFLGRMAGFLARVPVIVHTPHGHVFYGYFGFFWSRLFVTLERFAAHFTDRIITLTEVGKAEHLRFRISHEEKFVSIYCGIDLTRFQKKSQEAEEKLRKELGLEGVGIVGSVGRLVPVKGYEYFVRACALVKQTHPNTKFLLVGDGPLRTDLQKLAARLALEKNFLFTGERKEIPEILSLFDLFVLSSLNEGLGRVLIEAGAAGVPVVATEVGGVPEIVRNHETGLLVPPRDPEKMACAIRILLDDVPLRRKMGACAEERVWKNFGVEKMIEKTKSLYESLLQEKR